MSPEKDNKHKSLLHFYWVGFVFDKDSNICILPRGVVKLPSENPLEETFSLPSENKCWCFPVCGWNCFYFPFSMTAPPLDLNLYLYSCVYCCNLFQFMCASVSLFSWNLLLHLSICIFLPPILTSDVSSETWGKVFMKLSNWDWILWNLTLALHCCKTQV